MSWVGLWVQSFHFAMGWVEETGPTDNSGGPVSGRAAQFINCGLTADETVVH